MNETRSQCIVRHTEAFLRRTRTSMETFGSEVVEHYHAAVPEDSREIEFHFSGDAYRVMRANAQILRRFMEGAARLPVDLEESWVAALPRQHREACKADLAARYGLLAAPLPQVGEAAGHDGLARLFLEAGQAGEVLAQMLADGGIGPEDRPAAERALRELRDVSAAATALMAKIQLAIAAPGGEATCIRA